ncbi:YqgE/AlgH family protein [Fibrobacterota bacterium]
MEEISKPFNPVEHIKRLQNGCFLFATEILTDPNFASTIVLICQHSAEGTYGLVLNRLSHMPLSEVFNSLDIMRNHVRKIHIGGPVQESELQILHITENPVHNAIKVAGDVYLGGYWDNIDMIVNSESKDLRLFLGYSGWGKGQLENEIKLGGWEVMLANVKEVFNREDDPWNNGIEDFKQKYCHF